MTSNNSGDGTDNLLGPVSDRGGPEFIGVDSPGDLRNLMGTLEQVADRVRNCTDCPLSEGRTNAVPGEGNPQAEVMFIGEGPGFQEDRQGRPFVGPAGKLLDGLLASIGVNREQVFIANMVKCRPPNNRDPAPAELAACTKYLDRQIELVNPKLIVTLGRFAFGRYFPGEGITKARGKLRVKDGHKIFPVLHPAAVLRVAELRPTMIEDFKTIAEILVHATEAVSVEPGGNAAETPKTAQLSFVDCPDTASVSAPSANISTVNVEEEPWPKQLNLF
ncbi:MAG: uracil-DNA glycosylase [SAR202 cluster bacterium]|nr:uracil-DNA glycosylase [SAR202 cluster bacterium]